MNKLLMKVLRECRGRYKHSSAQHKKALAIPTLQEVEQDHIAYTMKYYEGNLSLTAASLGVTLKTLYNKIDGKYQPRPKRTIAKFAPSLKQAGQMWQSVHNLERRKVINALLKTEYNYSKAAMALGVSRGTLYNKVSRFGLKVRPK